MTNIPTSSGLFGLALIGAAETAFAQAPSRRTPPLDVGFSFEAATYGHPGRNPSGPEDRDFRPGFLLGSTVGGSYRLVGPDDPEQSGLRIQPFAQFRYLARWQVGLESFPFQLASYTLQAGTEFSYRFRRHEGNQHRVLVSFKGRHLSNGAGQTCTFFPNTWETMGRESCATPAGDLPSQLNRASGDYTSNQWGFSLGWQLFHRGTLPYFLAAGISPEFQCVGPTDCLRIENLSVAQADVYGHARIPIYAQIQLELGSVLLRGEIGAEYHTQTDPRVSPFRSWAEAMVIWPGLHGFGFVFQGNFGRDFQASFAVDSGVTVSLGIVFNKVSIDQWISLLR